MQINSSRLILVLCFFLIYPVEIKAQVIHPCVFSAAKYGNRPFIFYFLYCFL